MRFPIAPSAAPGRRDARAQRVDAHLRRASASRSPSRSSWGSRASGRCIASRANLEAVAQHSLQPVTEVAGIHASLDEIEMNLRAHAGTDVFFEKQNYVSSIQTAFDEAKQHIAAFRATGPSAAELDRATTLEDDLSKLDPVVFDHLLPLSDKNAAARVRGALQAERLAAVRRRPVDRRRPDELRERGRGRRAAGRTRRVHAGGGRARHACSRSGSRSRCCSAR